MNSIPRMCSALVAGSLVLIVTGCSKRASANSVKETDPSTAARAARLVTVASVVEQTMERTVAVIGSLAAHEEATLSVKVPGRLQTITVDLGSVVREGQ